ncbi:MAG: DUF4870 domain-containing protein [Eubacteriales bacterium]
MTKDEKIIAGLIPLFGLFELSIISIVLWVVKKDASEFINHCGKEYLNFFISTIIYAIVAFITIFVGIGFILFIALFIFSFIVCIEATIKGFNGEFYQYPFIIRFIR